MNSITHLIICVTQIIIVFSELPVPKCKLSDSNCIRSSAQGAIPVFTAGMPDIGTEPLDVMHVDNIKVDLAGLKLVVNDISIKGLRKANLTKTDVAMEKKQIAVAWDTDIFMKGHYKASGRLLVLPITGDGDFTLKLKKLHVDMTIPFTMAKTSDGKDMIDLKSYKYKYEVMDGANFQLTNLFNGNKVLSDTMLRFMNDNWKIISVEFGGPMLEKPNKKIYESIKTYLRSQPLENIAEY
ncbi:circadian clock-controlled protein-like [Hyposmocoma kahamanoa]|uniref:circadian clock-controlled protein-like n=1 Tax=Hyposmocoma kahamanoa TaxID=1477025 RepID=UPI000E6DA2F0|nr:circadian clock-controlled protein-like [Hyposmocoma kahamanoa]